MSELDRPADTTGSKAFRVSLGIVGVGGIAYGIARILTDSKDTKPLPLLKWLIGSLLLHDAVIAPVVIGIGWLLARYVPDRARPFVQGALVTGGLISSVALVLIWRQGKTSAKSLALLQQNYLAHLLILLAIVAAVTVGCYLITVSRSNRTKTRPPADQ
ncbi:MAG: hypothetical protein M3Y42_10860 [Actinomycetota bacterium]|nr:hypothetical protein [Actinomycetota bacterium]MDQ2957454.1 hypothetical protein [Actinomycetota bacterium]